MMSDKKIKNLEEGGIATGPMGENFSEYYKKRMNAPEVIVPPRILKKMVQGPTLAIVHDYKGGESREIHAPLEELKNKFLNEDEKSASLICTFKDGTLIIKKNAD